MCLSTTAKGTQTPYRYECLYQPVMMNLVFSGQCYYFIDVDEDNVFCNGLAVSSW